MSDNTLTRENQFYAEIAALRTELATVTQAFKAKAAELAQRTAERDALAAENADLKDRIATALFDKAAVERGVMRLRADLAQRTAERDEARRALCVSQAVDYLCETNPDEPISYDETRRIAAEFAAERGWDCFKKENK
jgi:regulator of replication initiation timing